MIKFISVILVLVFVVVSCADLDAELEEMELKFRRDLDICTNKTGLTEGQFQAVINFQIPKERAPMCFLACLAQDFNLMDANNKFTKAGINKLMNPLLEKLKETKEDKGQKFYDVLIKCVDEQTDEKDECVSAKNGFECFVTTAKKNGILHF